MGFSLSGSTIVQTGTDTSLDGLQNISGVTRSSDDGKSFYTVNDREIRVQGTLSIDPEIESIIFTNENNNITFDVRGTCNFGKEIDIGALVNRFSSGTLLMFTNPNNHIYSEQESDLYVSNGGTLNWYGGTVFTRRNFAIYGTLNTFSKNCEFINQHTGDVQIRMRSDTTQVNGLITRGCFLTLITNPIKWDGWNPYDCPAQALSFSGSTPDREFLILKGFDPSGLVGQQIAFWSDAWGRLINNALGMALVAGGNSDNSGQNKGIYEIRQEVNLTFSDLSGTPIEAYYWTTDFDNGNRVDRQINNNPSTLADRTYTGLATGGSSTIDADGGVLTGVIWRDVGGQRFDNNIYDYRCFANNSNDVFTFYSIKYGYLIDIAAAPLKGLVPVQLDRVMFLDTTITQQDKSIVDAYTRIDNSREFCDAAFAFLEDNITSYQERLVNRAGTEIDAGSNNIILDATANNAIAFDGSTITIHSDNFTGDLLTTGLITFVNGATISGSYTDQNGTVAPPVQFIVTVNQNGCDVVILEAGTDTVLASADSLSGNSFAWTYSGSQSVDVGVIKQGFIVNYTYNFNLTGENTTLPIKLITDRNYQ